MALNRIKGRLGKKVGVYNHPKFGGAITVYLDKQGTFASSFGEKTIKHKTLLELHAELKVLIEQSVSFKWLPTIHINFSSYRNNSDENNLNEKIEMKFKRFYIAKAMDSKWRQAEWDVEEGLRADRSSNFYIQIHGERSWDDYGYATNDSFALPYTEVKSKSTSLNGEWDNNPEYYLPYTEELWNTLIQLAKMLDQLERSIVDLCGRPQDLIKQISMNKKPLLGNGK